MCASAHVTATSTVMVFPCWKCSPQVQRNNSFLINALFRIYSACKLLPGTCNDGPPPFRTFSISSIVGAARAGVRSEAPAHRTRVRALSLFMPQFAWFPSSRTNYAASRCAAMWLLPLAGPVRFSEPVNGTAQARPYWIRNFPPPRLRPNLAGGLLFVNYELVYVGGDGLCVCVCLHRTWCCGGDLGRSGGSNCLLLFVNVRRDFGQCVVLIMIRLINNHLKALIYQLLCIYVGSQLCETNIIQLSPLYIFGHMHKYGTHQFDCLFEAFDLLHFLTHDN